MTSQPSTAHFTPKPRETAAAADELTRLTRELSALGAQRVVLFGSRARGEARPDSDTDLLVVMACPQDESYASRLARIALAIRPRIALDLVVYTPEEFERLLATRHFVQRAVSEGVVLHAA